MAVAGMAAHPGWAGGWMIDEEGLPHQADDAFRNGSRIVKVAVEEGDATPVGMGGTVLASVASAGLLPPEFAGVKHFYFVEWDNAPRTSVGIMDQKIELESAWNGQERTINLRGDANA